MPLLNKSLIRDFLMNIQYEYSIRGSHKVLYIDCMTIAQESLILVFHMSL